MQSRFFVWLWLWRRRLAGEAITEPGCGRCGYPVRGLSTSICPECGSDRGVVGIVEPLPPLTLRARRRLRVTAWSVLLLLAALLANPLLLPLTPRDLSNHRDYVITPISGAYGPFEVRRIAYGWGWKTPGWIPTRPLQGMIAPVRTGTLGPTYSEFEFRQGSSNYYYATYDASGRQTSIGNWPGTLNEQAVASWFGQLGLNVQQEPIKTEIHQLYEFITALDFSPVHEERLTNFRLVSKGGGPEIAPPDQGQMILVAGWVLLWLVGVVILWRKGRDKDHGLNWS